MADKKTSEAAGRNKNNMAEQKKEYASKKALYLLLCGLLGLILFAIIQQAAMLLLTLLLTNQAGYLEAGQQTQLSMFDSVSYILAMFFGSWYGIWLGLHWHAIVYEQGRRGLFHAFLGRLAGSHVDTPETGTPIMARPQPVAKQAAPQTARLAVRKTSWEFEDLAKLRPVTPRPARTMVTDEDGTWTKKVAVKSAQKRNGKKPTPSPAATGSRRKVTAKAAVKEVL